jgi:hypothetical protein
MKILGYCALWAIAAALLIAMCSIVQDSVRCRQSAAGTPAAGTGVLASRIGNN